MGLFVAEDGHYQGWLATLLCCCAALDEDEHPIEKRKNAAHCASTRTSICNEQPAPCTALPSMPPPAYTSIDQKSLNASHPRETTGQQDRPPSFRAPRPVDSSETLRQNSHVRQQSSRSQSRRRSISNPSSFRRVEYSEGQRANLLPLKLAPVVLQPPLSASDGTQSRAQVRTSSEEQRHLANSEQERFRTSREPPRRRYSNPTAQIARSSVVEAAASKSAKSTSNGQTVRPSMHRKSSPSLLPRPLHESSAISLGSHDSSERKRLRRIGSHHSLRHAQAETTDIEKEILELNTIVEERRAEASRAKLLDHIAAVAPTMTLSARSETLNDIGSAFARPYTPREPEHIRSVLDGPERVPKTDANNTRPVSSSRVSGWLSGLMSSNSSSTNQAWSEEPFYKCRPVPRHRADSDASTIASVTEVDCQSATASSAVSRGYHSRTTTTESRMTHPTPPSTIYRLDLPNLRKQEEEFWPMPRASPPASQVGLAF